MKHMSERVRRAGFLALAVLLCLSMAAPALADRSSRTTPVVKAVREVGPAVVNISTTSQTGYNPFRTGDDYLDRFFEDFFGPMQRESRTLGSGVIIDGKAGLIATNYHVVSQATEIKVQLADRRTFTAEVVGSDPKSDLAVLRIHSQKPLPQARLGDSSDLMIGESVIAIGNPFGLSHTVTTGVVSALDRRVRIERGYLSGLIQIDASINPGNSGGPLLNTDGEVIGINSAIYRRGQGIGFAIEINRVKRVAEDLVSHGEVIPTWLGLYLQDLSPALAQGFGIGETQGAVITEVMSPSPALKAGLKRGDVIVAVDGRNIKDSSHYGEALGAVQAGRQVRLTVLRRGQRVDKTVDSRPFPLERAPEVAYRVLGFSVTSMDAGLARRHGVQPGSAVAVKEVRPGSQADQIGLVPGDLIRKLGDTDTTTLHRFNSAMARSRLLPQLTVLVQRGRARQYITIER